MSITIDPKPNHPHTTTNHHLASTNTNTTTAQQYDTSDTASVATTSSLSSRLTLLKDKLRPSSADDKAREQQKQKAKDDVLRNQIRMNV